MGRLDARVALITAAARGQGAAETTSRFGRPDVVVNNAASSGSSIAYTASKFAVLELAPFGVRVNYDQRASSSSSHRR